MMLGLMGMVRMVVALLHDWEGLDKCLVAGQIGAPSRAKQQPSLRGIGAVVRPSTDFEVAPTSALRAR